MADVTSLLQTLFSGGADAQPEGVRALEATAPMTGATVLARLRGGQDDATGALGKAAAGAGGTLPNVNGSKVGALAAGFASGMANAAAARALQQKQTLELMKAQWDQQHKLAELEEKKASNKETARYHDILGKYYEGQNNKKDKEEDPSSPANISKIEQARRQRAITEGLFDKALINHANGAPAMAGDTSYLDEKVVKDAQAELARRQKAFKEWDAAQSWSKGGKSAGVPKGSGEPDATGADPDATAPDANTPDAPLPPPRPPMFKVSPLESTSPTPQGNANVSPMIRVVPKDGSPEYTETLRPVIGPDGQKFLWGEKSGLRPFAEGQGATAVPGTPPPPGLSSPDDAIPGFSG
jgi:hypothetical protein